jgi:hypothetical protein
MCETVCGWYDVMMTKQNNKLLQTFSFSPSSIQPVIIVMLGKAAVREAMPAGQDTTLKK